MAKSDLSQTEICMRAQSIAEQAAQVIFRDGGGFYRLVSQAHRINRTRLFDPYVAITTNARRRV